MRDPKLPDLNQFELRRQELTDALDELSNELAQCGRNMAAAADAPELAASVRRTLAVLSNSANGWELTSETIRDCWGV